MSGYTSGNNAPTLMAQAPNRKGNMSKHTPGAGGVTAVTRSMGSTAYGKGRQGAPAAGGNPGAGRGQKVQVSRPADNCGYNDSYRNSSYLA
jgi:hypothetical protein